jgi:transcriptional antiterminator RfaH
MRTTLTPRWYCVRTRPKQEHIAAASLRSLPEVHVFNPQLRIRRATNRGPVHFTESVFPCYLFAHFELSQSLQQVRYAYGVSSVVQFLSQIPHIPTEVIDDLRRTFEANADTIFVEAPGEGDHVAICTGPFQGHEAVVTRVLPAKERVQVLLDVMGRSTTMELNFNSILLERANRAAILPSLGSGA